MTSIKFSEEEVERILLEYLQAKGRLPRYPREGTEIELLFWFSQGEEPTIIELLVTEPEGKPLASV